MSTRDKGKGTRSKSDLGRYCKSTGGRACPRAYRYRSRSRSTNSIYVSTISSTILSGLSSSCSSRLKTSNGSKPPGGASSIMDVSLYRIRLNHASLARYDIFSYPVPAFCTRYLVPFLVPFLVPVPATEQSPVALLFQIHFVQFKIQQTHTP